MWYFIVLTNPLLPVTAELYAPIVVIPSLYSSNSIPVSFILSFIYCRFVASLIALFITPTALQVGSISEI